MHTIDKTPITLDSFEISDFHNLKYEFENQRDELKFPLDNDFVQMGLIPYLENLRLKYLETKDQTYWKELIRWLPEGWMQKRTITMNYENLLGMCSKGQRRFHKLTEWSGEKNSFISFVHTLPYAEDFIFIEQSIKAPNFNSSIIRVIDKRDTGKTKKLILAAKEKDALVVCANPDAMAEKALRYGIIGVHFISYEDFIEGHEFNYDTPFMVDELEIFMKKLFNNNINPNALMGYSLTNED